VDSSVDEGGANCYAIARSQEGSFLLRVEAKRVSLYLTYPLGLRRKSSADMSNIVSMVIKIQDFGANSPLVSWNRKELAKKGKRIRKAFGWDIVLGLLLAVVALGAIMPKQVFQDEAFLAAVPDEETVGLMIAAMQNEAEQHGRLPDSEDAPLRSMKIPITAYASVPEQTDATPCITASGFDVCQHGVENIVAANFLPLGTRVKIPELYGDRVFYVEDRMNARYYYKMDIWMKDNTEARRFGVQYATVEIF